MVKGDAVRMEALDARVLLSASLSAGGTLTIVGTRHADSIDLRIDAGNPAQLRLSIGGGAAFFPFSAVKRVYVNGGRGNDTIRLSGDRPATILGGLGDDTLEGTERANRVEGGPGNDQIGTAGGNDTVFGGDGDDVTLAGNGNNVIDGGNGDDTLNAGTGNDSIIGGIGHDRIASEGGRDTLLGNNGSDVIIAGGVVGGRIEGGKGADFLTGGANTRLFGGRDNDVFSTPSLDLVRDAQAGDRVDLT